MPRNIARQFPRVLAAALVITCAGCGPFGYLKKVAVDATRAVEDAKAAGAEEYAPYEYWGAVAYLEQSKILMGYSEYERSFDFGERAVQLANEAKVKAKRVQDGGSIQHDDTIAAPTDMVDQDGNKAETLEDAQKGGDGAGDADASAEGSGKVELKAGGE